MTEDKTIQKVKGNNNLQTNTNIENLNMLADFQSETIQLKKENEQLKEELNEEKAKNDIREKLAPPKDKLPYLKEDYKHYAKGHYCSRCLEKEGYSIRLKLDYSYDCGDHGRYKCPECENDYKVGKDNRPMSGVVTSDRMLKYRG